MGTLTSNYSFQKPTVGADSDNWGDDYTSGDPLVDPSPGLNGNWEKADALIKDLVDKVAALEAKTLIPVGGLYTSTDDDDPATTLGYGQWAAYAGGRALVSVGTADGVAWTAGQTRGEADVALAYGQMPSHRHYNDPGSQYFETRDGGSHTHTPVTGGSFAKPQGNSGQGEWNIGSGSYSGAPYDNSTNAAGVHRHGVDVNISPFYTDYQGSGTAHNNIQPSVGVYVWRRTA